MTVGCKGQRSVGPCPEHMRDVVVDKAGNELTADEIAEAAESSAENSSCAPFVTRSRVLSRPDCPKCALKIWRAAGGDA